MCGNRSTFGDTGTGTISNITTSDTSVHTDAPATTAVAITATITVTVTVAVVEAGAMSIAAAAAAAAVAAWADTRLGDGQDACGGDGVCVGRQGSGVCEWGR